MTQNRWIEVSPSAFAHETEGLRRVRNLLPDEPGYRAWSNFEFRDGNGIWSEVDLLLLLPSGMHLVELKYYSGTIRGNDSTWIRHGRAEDSPLKLARRKAQRLASKMKDAWHEIEREHPDPNLPHARDVVPWVEASVFLHHPDVRVDLPYGTTKGLYGIDGAEDTSHLESIASLIQLPADPRRRGRAHEDILAALLKRIGLTPATRVVESWELQSKPLASGEGWQDWLGVHKLTGDEARLRFQTATDGTSEAELRNRNAIVLHEFRTVGQLRHEHILVPKNVVQGDLGLGLVYDHSPKWHRLDHWLAEHPQGIALDDQLSIIRQVGDALAHAHANRVVHRGIDPQSVLIEDRDGSPRVLVGGWEAAGNLPDGGSRNATVTGVTRLLTEQSAAMPGFAAPEGALMRRIDRTRVDVFGLGALAAFVLTGKAPAATAGALRERLQRDGGIDVSVDLPQIAPQLRDAILHATRPSVTDRAKDVATFITELTARQAPATQQIDPLEASAGDVLGGRFTVERRLGSGSTALGLLVKDAKAEDKLRVLKIAVDDAAGERLDEEAAVLAQVRSPRVAKLIDGPIEAEGRRALLLEHAGDETLTHWLRTGQRLVLDLQERWGLNLLDAVVDLDEAGIMHRDIKPSNLGIRTNPGKRTKELHLFDFSLSRTPVTSITAGTPPYLDPFLSRQRPYDSAAERYAVAVVLFEMATGHTPVFGDGYSDPASIRDEATVDPADFDPTVGQRLAGFFRKALARDTAMRHLTIQEMRSAWAECFPASETAISEQADELAAAACLETPLAAAGLSARARSALEPYQVVTVADLLALDRAIVSGLRGAKMATRKEIQSRSKQWRDRFGEVTTHEPAQARDTSTHELAELFLAALRGKRRAKAVDLAAHLLGVVGDVDAFGTQSEYAAALDVTPARVSQLLPELQSLWGGDEAARAALDRLRMIVDRSVSALGGVATPAELSDALAAELAIEPQSDDYDERRLEGLVRVAVDRRRAVASSEDDDGDTPLAMRRTAGHLLLAEDPELLTLAEQLGRRADELVSRTNVGGATDALVPVGRMLAELRPLLPADNEALTEPSRLAALAAATAQRARSSSIGELHHRALPQSRAIALTVGALGSRVTLHADELRQRVAARFPSLPPLPTRPKLDELLTDVPLRFDEDRRSYVSTTRSAVAGTELESRPATRHIIEVRPVSEHGVVGQRLLDSTSHRSFLALGVEATRLTRLTEVLTTRYGAVALNLSAKLLDAMRTLAKTSGLPWEAVLSADAAAPGSRPSMGLEQLIERSMGDVDAAIATALSQGSPVYLVDASLYVRHGGLSRLANWIDLTTHREQALWLEVPQLHANRGPLLELKPLPLSAPSQYVPVDGTWLDRQYRKDVA